MAYNRGAHDAWLRFMGIRVFSHEAPDPEPLSPQAQRIVLNLMAGRAVTCAGRVAILLIVLSNLTQYNE